MKKLLCIPHLSKMSFMVSYCAVFEKLDAIVLYFIGKDVDIEYQKFALHNLNFEEKCFTKIKSILLLPK